MVDKRVKMSRLIHRSEDNGQFDLDFWQQMSPQARYEATWEMVVSYYLSKGKTLAELRLDRSIARLKRRKG